MLPIKNLTPDQSDRLNHANALIKIISSHGRRFFWDEKSQQVAVLKIDHQCAMWFVEPSTNNHVLITPPRPTGKRGRPRKDVFWVGFRNGGTLRNLIENIRDYVLEGTRLNRHLIAPQRVFQSGNIWGYLDDDAQIVREQAFSLPIMAPPTPEQEIVAEQCELTTNQD